MAKNLKTKFYNICVKVVSKCIRGPSNRRRFLDIFIDKSGDEYFNHAYDMGANIGRHSYLGEGCWVYDKRTQIGSFCAISHNVLIGAGQHPLSFLSVHPFQYAHRFVGSKKMKASFESYLPVTVGNDVWIGCNVVIMDGVKIGDGAIIGSNAVVTKDIPPYAISVGVPARVVRYRFDETVIKELLHIKWWEFDDQYLADLPFDDIAACIEKLKIIRG